MRQPQLPNAAKLLWPRLAGSARVELSPNHRPVPEEPKCINIYIYILIGLAASWIPVAGGCGQGGLGGCLATLRVALRLYH